MQDAGKILVVYINEENLSGVARFTAIPVCVPSIRTDRLHRFCRTIQQFVEATNARRKKLLRHPSDILRFIN